MFDSSRVAVQAEENPMPTENFSQEIWEDYDARSLFPDRLHTNKLTKIDKVNLNKVDQEDPGEQGSPPPAGSDAGPPQDGDSYTESSPEKNHEDHLYEMEGDGSGSADDRDVKADKEEDLRTEEQDASDDSGSESSESSSEPAESGDESSSGESSSESFDSKEGEADPGEASEGAESGEANPFEEEDWETEARESENQTSGKEEDSDAGEPSEAKDAKEGGESQGSDESDETPEAEEAEGAEKPIQKESEGIEEVAEATSKTSEDVHGGDEATKDIEDSTNAANDGQNPDNQGAESGEGGDSGDGQGEDEENESESDGEGSPFGSDLDESEDWESLGAASVSYQMLANPTLEKPLEAGGGGAAVDYRNAPRVIDDAEKRKIFLTVRELIKKLVNEEDLTQREDGSSRWDARQLAMKAAKYQHPRIPTAKFDRPKNNKIVFFMDVSGSVSYLAELFMALMGGAAGIPGVWIVVGSEAHAEYEIAVPKPFKKVEEAVEYFCRVLNHQDEDHPMGECPAPRTGGWTRPYDQPFEPGVKQFLQDKGLWGPDTTCVFFGDMQGVHFNTPDLREIVREVKCLWLFTDGPGHYTHTDDLPKAIEAQLPIVYNIRSARAFAWAVRRLSRIRPGLKMVVPPDSQ